MTEEKKKPQEPQEEKELSIEEIIGRYLLNGHVSIPVLKLVECARVLDSVLGETYKMAFRGVDLSKIKDPSLLLNDIDLRRKHEIQEDIVWIEGNTRKPIVSKNGGFTNIYHNRLVRDLILFSEKIHHYISQLYKAVCGEEEIAYTNGPDRVGVKAKDATDMPKHLDKHLFIDAPKLKARVQAFVCLGVDERTKSPSGAPEMKPRETGGIEVLENFHHYFLLARIFFKGKFETSDAIPQNLPKEFDDNLDAFNAWITKILYSKKKPLMNKELREVIKTNKFPEKQLFVGWVIPKVRVGDLFCFDTRLPHRNLKNKSTIPRVVAYVSYFLKSDATGDSRRPERSERDILGMFSGEESAHGGSNRDKKLEKEVFAKDWAERVEITLTPFIKRILSLT
jgi:hypothetical protein